MIYHGCCVSITKMWCDGINRDDGMIAQGPCMTQFLGALWLRIDCNRDNLRHRSVK